MASSSFSLFCSYHIVARAEDSRRWLKKLSLLGFFFLSANFFGALSLSNMGTVCCGLDFTAEAIKRGRDRNVWLRILPWIKELCSGTKLADIRKIKQDDVLLQGDGRPAAQVRTTPAQLGCTLPL